MVESSSSSSAVSSVVNSPIGSSQSSIISSEYDDTLKESDITEQKETTRELRRRILLHLITRLQAICRGRQTRARFAVKRQTQGKLDELRRAVFQAANEREARRSGLIVTKIASLEERASGRRLPDPTQCNDDLPILTTKSATIVQHEPPPLTRATHDPVVSIPLKPLDRDEEVVVDADQWEEEEVVVEEYEEEDVVVPCVEGTVLLNTEIVPRIEFAESGGVEAINTVKAKILTYECQADLVWYEANSLVLSAARSIGQVPTNLMTFEDSSRNLLNPQQPLSIIIPQNVDGVIADGILVDQTSPVKGAPVGGTGWAVAEVLETEEYELHPRHITRAASRIQTVFRRFLTRRKFIAYIQEKQLDTLREEERTADNSSGAVGGIPTSADAVNTDSCVIS